MKDETAGWAMVRVNRTDLDLSFAPGYEKALAATAASARQIGRFTTRGGAFIMVGGLAVAFVFPAIGGAAFMIGFLTVVAGLTARVVGLTAGAPARGLRWLRMGRLRRGKVGHVLRLRGVVRAQKILDGPGSASAVLARIRASREGHGVEMQCGHDFLLEDGAGDPAQVLVEHAHMLDEPAPRVGFHPNFPLRMVDLLPAGEESIEYAEALVRPGDLVEVLGIYDERVDPMVDRLERGVPLRRVIHGSERVPVLVRRVAGDVQSGGPR